MKNIKLTALKLTRTAFISFFGALLFILFAAMWRNGQGVAWSEIGRDYVPSYLESILIFVIMLTLFRGLLLVKGLHIEDQLGFMNWMMEDMPIGLGYVIAIILFLAFFIHAIILGVVWNYDWSIPGMTTDQALYVCMGLAAFFGLCGRGVGLTYVVFVPGIAAFMMGSLTDYFVLQVFILGSGLVGWIFNRIIYLIFVHKWDVETVAEKK